MNPQPNIGYTPDVNTTNITGFLHPGDFTFTECEQLSDAVVNLNLLLTLNDIDPTITTNTQISFLKTAVDLSKSGNTLYQTRPFPASQNINLPFIVYNNSVLLFDYIGNYNIYRINNENIKNSIFSYSGQYSGSGQNGLYLQLNGITNFNNSFNTSFYLYSAKNSFNNIILSYCLYVGGSSYTIYDNYFLKNSDYTTQQLINYNVDLNISDNFLNLTNEILNITPQLRSRQTQPIMQNNASLDNPFTSNISYLNYDIIVNNNALRTDNLKFSNMTLTFYGYNTTISTSTYTSIFCNACDQYANTIYTNYNYSYNNTEIYSKATILNKILMGRGLWNQPTYTKTIFDNISFQPPVVHFNYPVITNIDSANVLKNLVTSYTSSTPYTVYVSYCTMDASEQPTIEYSTVYNGKIINYTTDLFMNNYFELLKYPYGLYMTFLRSNEKYINNKDGYYLTQFSFNSFNSSYQITNTSYPSNITPNLIYNKDIFSFFIINPKNNNNASGEYKQCIADKFFNYYSYLYLYINGDLLGVGNQNINYTIKDTFLDESGNLYVLIYNKSNLKYEIYSEKLPFNLNVEPVILPYISKINNINNETLNDLILKGVI